MATVTVRLPDEKHERLKLMAKRHGISLNKLFEEVRRRPSPSSMSRRGFAFERVEDQSSVDWRSWTGSISRLSRTLGSRSVLEP